MTALPVSLRSSRQRQDHGHHHRSRVEQGALVRIVEVRRIGENAVRHRRKCRVGLGPSAAPDRCRSRCTERLDQIRCNAPLGRIVLPRTDGATDRVEDDVTGLRDDVLRQGLKSQLGCKSSQDLGCARWRDAFGCHSSPLLQSGANLIRFGSGRRDDAARKSCTADATNEPLPHWPICIDLMLQGPATKPHKKKRH